MREILFRGKRVDNVEWVISNTFYQCEGKIKLWDEPNRDGYVEVDPETVGQYTGLTDKNGIAMYEGDIIHGAAHWLERYVSAVVTFRNGSFGLLWYRGEIEEFNPFTSMCNVEYTVVGNIYDNPELMKGGE